MEAYQMVLDSEMFTASTTKPEMNIQMIGISVPFIVSNATFNYKLEKCENCVKYPGNYLCGEVQSFVKSINFYFDSLIHLTH